MGKATGRVKWRDPTGAADYLYRLHTSAGVVERPDPASRCQPRGVHGPSRVVDPHFDWQDQAWKGIPLSQWILYELHVGTFTPEGTFAALIPRLPQLVELGVNVLELMPVAQFPGSATGAMTASIPMPCRSAMEEQRA